NCSRSPMLHSVLPLRCAGPPQRHTKKLSPAIFSLEDSWMRPSSRPPARCLRQPKNCYSQKRRDWVHSSASGVTRRRFAMLRTDLDTSASAGLPVAVSPVPGYLRLRFPVILLSSCFIFGATRCTAQDVAEAARQERTRKESQQKKPKHVYTDQDLKRAQ